MTSKVKVNMDLCSYVHDIEVSKKEDGTYSVKIESPCEKVRDLAANLETLDMWDIMEWSSSKLLEKMKESNVGLHCSVPAGIMNAAKLEAGLIAGSMAKRVKGNSWEFVFD